MAKLRVLELFAGIGAFTKGLSNIRVNYELVGFSEIDKRAISSYCAIHNVSEDLNLGDVSKIDIEAIPNHDLLTYSFPCTNISKAGRMEGLTKGSGTASSLLWEAMKIAEIKKPKYMIAENVPNLLSKKFKKDFDRWLIQLDGLGYNTYYKILNARDYGICQNRERVFAVSIRKDINDGDFKFPNKKELNMKLKDLLDEEVDDKYYLSEEAQNQLIHHRDGNRIFIINGTKLGYLEAFDGDGIDLGYPKSKTRRGRVQPQRSQTLTTSDNLGVLLGDRIRKYTPKESIKLMGFTEEDYNKMKDKEISDRQIYKIAGNSIVVNVVEEIFKELLNKYIK